MRKKIITITMVAVVGLGSVLFNTPASADSLEDLKSEETQIQQDRKDVKANLSNAESEIADILIELEEINVEISRITKALEENKASLKKNEEDISHRQMEIDLLEDEIVELEEAIEKRFEILKERAVAYQKSGGNISYIEVLFGSQSFGDFISRVSVINKITNSDAALMEQIEADKVKVEEKQEDVVIKLAELKDLRLELEGMQALIEDQKKETKIKQASLKEKEEKLVAKVEELKLEDSKLAALEKKVKGNMTALTQPAPATQIASASAGSNGDLSTLSNQSSGGYLAWPAVGGYISSYVGPRWGRQHNGIDIARPSNYNILAAADGVVTKAGHTGGFGNRIEIEHSNGLKTLYAHLSSINVTVGQEVSTGTVIGIMGNTGNSTGIHLHFEVYKNGALQDPMYYLN
ncbi:murein hydrolase activator EnvC family protein [Oceanobacillus alkalisoli]|uniref:murein hydrolase activator EnvC family protein n=1 Tax=Oceanobacillus alkalisoli TaxID=2925113 RepID=UPI001EEFFA31|nr:peptidoglycan DD-metalloendopeptidase family protein [Oceanobacillus alkalisoli]MCF3942263.1 peptidoglycan DD-metalloendopeptidase family protein [Oceanobacillus alkalisoli]MCG5104499.1 peptidoglycan DD-metalloendopeptidase family protein [Oceanobacillus alkalisoli]